MSGAECVPLVPQLRCAPHLWLPFILVHLSVRDWFNLRAVSREIFSLVNDHFRQMTQLDLSQLRGIRFNWNHFHILTENNHSLRHLNLADAWWVDEHAFANQFLPRQTHLVSVDLSRSHSVTNITIVNLACFCPFIEMLTLKHCHWLSQESFLLLVERLEHLREIDVSSCWNIDNHCVQILFQKQGDVLRRVILGSLYSLSDKATEAIQEYGTSLTYLDISSCWRITDKGAKNLSRNESIEQIALDGCSQVSIVGRRLLLDNGISLVNPSCP